MLPNLSFNFFTVEKKVTNMNTFVQMTCLFGIITSSLICLIGKLKVTSVSLNEMIKNNILLINFEGFKKSTLFLSYYSIEYIRHNSLTICKFLKSGVPEKYILVSSIAKFTRLVYVKLILI